MSKLVDTLRASGYQLKPEGQGNYRVLGHQRLIVKDDFWYQHSTGKSGHAIQLLMILDNISFANAKKQFNKSIYFPEKINTLFKERPQGCSSFNIK